MSTAASIIRIIILKLVHYTVTIATMDLGENIMVAILFAFNKLQRYVPVLQDTYPYLSTFE